MKGLAMKKYVLPAIVAAAALSSASAFAADLQPVYKAPPPPVSYNPWDIAIGGALMTDYNFRGISQSARGMAGTAYIEGRYKPIKDVEFYAGSQAWTVGAKVYWDDTNKRCTTVATDNTLIGVAVEAVASGASDTIGRVRLNAAF